MPMVLSILIRYLNPIDDLGNISNSSSSCIYALIPVFINVGLQPGLKAGTIVSSTALKSYPAEYFVFLIGKFIFLSSKPFATSNPLIFSILNFLSLLTISTIFYMQIHN